MLCHNSFFLPASCDAEGDVVKYLLEILKSQWPCTVGCSEDETPDSENQKQTAAESRKLFLVNSDFSIEIPHENQNRKTYPSTKNLVD